ncbi:S-adenosyl-L-methionine-dependent methyltransferase [Venustampulla echinocandica]|uniref:S-adenosyl-L-methionine-dependent methyltransferase n=1 Tax=Venustampulla echinocandica TaxID=2656787 RepID=A0A370TTJ3_9HELO|nr:S-adenosyl-L-methionine-dependent methyltransferase [Venustampulla echinocandica]RDL38847.1 S-adenosyl-L-methionine-dependent methyltransferase [Venustampulla echinocandica]
MLPTPAMYEYDVIEAESSDGFDTDSAYAGSSAGSLTETLASSIARGVEEHGRTYAAYGNEGKSDLYIDTPLARWLIMMADNYPSAEVLGLDIAPVQPHCHIKPGGYIELQCVYPKLCCDDGSCPPESGLMTYSRHALEAASILGVPLDACIEYASYLTAAGFEDVTERRFKMPNSPWAKEKRLKLIGAFEMHNLLRGISGMSLRMFNKAYGWSRDQIELFLVQVRKDIANMRYHSYYEFVIVYGRKPGATTTENPTPSQTEL